MRYDYKYRINNKDKGDLAMELKELTSAEQVVMKCHHCGRVMTLKNFKEGELLDKVEQDKYYI